MMPKKRESITDTATAKTELELAAREMSEAKAAHEALQKNIAESGERFAKAEKRYAVATKTYSDSFAAGNVVRPEPTAENFNRVDQ